MAIDFPASPTLNDVFTVGTVNYVWDGTKWTAAVTGGIALDKIEEGNTAAEVIDTGSDGRFVVTTEAAERLRIDSSGNVGIGTASASGKLHVSSGASSGLVSADADDLIVENNGNCGITIASPNSGTGSIRFTDPQNNDSGAISYNHNDESLRFNTFSTERMRISSTGELRHGVENPTSSSYVFVKTDGNTCYIADRLSSDGDLFLFRQAGTQEGSISVSGTTVSYNGAHLSRWSQLPGGVERTEILRGTVLSNIDEMCEWAYEAEAEVLWTEDDELPEGVNVGDVKTPAKAAGTEDNEQLNRMKVSDVEGDKNVSGVFQAWDDDDDTYTNDFYCAMTGDFVIRIAQGVTVERGDLLMSAGDGTAKPQDDDIIRSKTIAKVTSTNVSCTYDDGSYCVPCVLMAC